MHHILFKDVRIKIILVFFEKKIKDKFWRS
jgi:hypothetical protein